MLPTKFQASRPASGSEEEDLNIFLCISVVFEPRAP